MKSSNIYCCIDLVINGLLPLAYVEKSVIRRNIKTDPISRHTLMKYMNLLTESVERKIAKLLPSHFAIVFDGWTNSSTHYLCVFASFPSNSTNGYSMRLLTISPMGDECRLDSTQHYEFLYFVLELYSKSWNNLVALIGDNVTTNNSLSNMAKVPLIGCCSHRFNLAICDVLSNENEIISKVNAIVMKLSSLLLIAKLR